MVETTVALGTVMLAGGAMIFAVDNHTATLSQSYDHVPFEGCTGIMLIQLAFTINRRTSDSMFVPDSMIIPILIVLGFWAWTYTMAAVTWFALYPEIWESVKDRSEVVMYRQIFAIFGGALAVAAFPIIVESLSKTENNFNGWIFAAVILGTIFAGAYLFSIVGIKERKEFVIDKSL